MISAVSNTEDSLQVEATREFGIKWKLYISPTFVNINVKVLVFYATESIPKYKSVLFELYLTTLMI